MGGLVVESARACLWISGVVFEGWMFSLSDMELKLHELTTEIRQRQFLAAALVSKNNSFFTYGFYRW